MSKVTVSIMPSFRLLFPGVKFRFDPASYSVSEADGMATLTIVQFDRAAGATGDITVLFSTADGTAEGEGYSSYALFTREF